MIFEALFRASFIFIHNQTMKQTSIHSRLIGVFYANSLFSGYGHHRVEVELEYQGNYQKFYAITNNMPEIDKIKSLEEPNVKYMQLYMLISNDIEEQVFEWILSIENQDYETNI